MLAGFGVVTTDCLSITCSCVTANSISCGSWSLAQTNIRTMNGFTLRGTLDPSDQPSAGSWYDQRKTGTMTPGCNGRSVTSDVPPCVERTGVQSAQLEL